MMPRSAIVAEARAWIGTKYQHQQRARGVAVDCLGLVIGVGRALGLVEPGFDFNGYSRQPDGTLLATADRYMRRIERADMQPGDVLVTQFEADPCHFGIVADYLHGGLSVVHALGTRDGGGRVIEHRLAFHRRCQFVAAYQMPGVA